MRDVKIEPWHKGKAVWLRFKNAMNLLESCCLTPDEARRIGQRLIEVSEEVERGSAIIAREASDAIEARVPTIKG
jgi:hypothetical protein